MRPILRDCWPVGLKADDAPRLAIVDCTPCQKRHRVRVNDGRARVACGALAEGFYEAGKVVVVVWPPGREDALGQRATVPSVLDS